MNNYSSFTIFFLSHALVREVFCLLTASRAITSKTIKLVNCQTDPTSKLINQNKNYQNSSFLIPTTCLSPFCLTQSSQSSRSFFGLVYLWRNELTWRNVFIHDISVSPCLRLPAAAWGTPSGLRPIGLGYLDFVSLSV